MSKLQQLLQHYCPNGVEWKTLDNCCEILDNKRKPVTKSAREGGKYPYYGANGIQDYVSDYIFDGTFILVGEDGSVITKNGNPIVTWAKGKIWVNNHAHIIKEKENVLLRFLYHFIQTVDITSLIHGNIPKLTGGDFKSLSIPVPPLAVQTEIARILDKFSALTAELKAELKARKKQYEYYRNQLLDFSKGEVEWKTLGEVAENISSGKNKEKLLKGKYPVFGSTGIIAYTDKYKHDIEQILVARVGANAGYVHKANGYYDVSDNTIIIKVKPDIVLQYLFYFLQKININTLAKGGGQPLITASDLKKILIPIPSLVEQARIVSILDKFDTLVNSITEGLPKEIALRQKQYEYYRNLLLTFPQKNG